MSIPEPVLIKNENKICDMWHFGIRNNDERATVKTLFYNKSTFRCLELFKKKKSLVTYLTWKITQIYVHMLERILELTSLLKIKMNLF